MEVKITNSDLPLSQHDTGSVNLELLYAELAAMRQLVETLTLTTKELKATIKEQTAAIQKQDKTIEEQNKEIRKLTNTLKKKESELSESKELVKTLKTLLSSKEVDLDALRRLLFQGGREQKKDKKESAFSECRRKAKTASCKQPAPKQTEQFSKDRLLRRRERKVPRFQWQRPCGIYQG